MVKSVVKNYKYRMDFEIKYEPLEGEKDKHRILLIPNSKRYEHHVKNGIEGYMDKYDNIFLPLTELANAMNNASNIPINMPPSRIGNLKEYCELRYEQLEHYYSEDFINKTFKLADNFVFMSIDIVNSTQRSKNLDIKINTLTNLLFLREVEEIINCFEGKVIKYVGDGLIAYFPSPNIIGKIDNSIECALSIRTFVEDYINKFLNKRKISPLKFRIGINHGEGYIIELGQQEDIYGHALDITHKIQECADVNQIVIGSKSTQLAHSVWREKLNKLDFDSKKEKKPELENIVLYGLEV